MRDKKKIWRLQFMKKLQILLGALAICTAANAAQLEVKAGFETFREGKNGYADFDKGASIGAEVLFNSADNPVDYGFGIERKSHLKGDNGSSNRLNGANAYPLYLTAKKHMNDDMFYVVGRAGWSIYENSRAEDGLYLGAGLGKQFGAVTLEGMYEHFDVNTNAKLFSGDQAGVFSLKVGYRFGENRRDIIAREKEEEARLEQERYMQEQAKKKAQEEKDAESLRLAQEFMENERLMFEAARENMLKRYENMTITASYEVNETVTYELDGELMNKINTDLANESGVIEIKAYTDSRGSEALNKELSQERADRVAESIRGRLTNNNIEVRSEGMGKTNYLNDNSTPELRRENRRVELRFIAN